MDSSIESYIVESIRSSIKTKEKILGNNALINKIIEIASLCTNCFKNNNKIIIAGNGGSAADAQHIAAEFISRFEVDRKPISAIALTTDTSILTAIGNDYTFDNVFSRQILGLGLADDCFIGISTSGNSRNILKAVEAAKEKGMKTVCLTGEGGQLAEICDISIQVPSQKTPRIQESHILIAHIICGLVEKELIENELV